MSKHLRHCPKHRKSLPCPHCAVIVQKPAIGPPLDEAPPDPFADRLPLVGPVRMSAEAIGVARRKEAERGRERRKKKREQLARMKEQLKVPVRDILRKAEELKQALGAESSDMAQGAFIAYAPTGKGRLVYSEDIGRIADKTDVPLAGQPTDHSSWGEHDRRNVKPEGIGAEFEDTGPSFVVNGTNLDRGQALLNLFHRLSEGFICRLCYLDSGSRHGFERHLEQVHGDESEPKHDHRFGDIISPEAAKVKRARTV